MKNGEPINQSINQQLNQSTQCQYANPSFSTSFQSNFSQVSGKFLVVLFHSFVVKSNIFSSNSNILVVSSIQFFINFLA